MATHTGRNSPPTLWEQAVQLWKDLVAGFGHQHDLMRWGRMRALYHRVLGHELRELESHVRQAIRADADDLELPPLKPVVKRPARPQPTSNADMPRFRQSYNDDCETWKVSFRMSERERGPSYMSYRRRPPNPDPEAMRPCRTFAFRIEALRRAINFRGDYVRRYALRLARIEEARLRVMAEHIARAKAAKAAREELLSVLSAEFGPPEDNGDGLLAFNVPTSAAEHIEPG